MVQVETALRRRADARLSALSKQILLLLSERGSVALPELPAALKADPALCGMAAGWLVRSRVIDGLEEEDGRMILRIHGSPI
jgi:hypothetical protein